MRLHIRRLVPLHLSLTFVACTSSLTSPQDPHPSVSSQPHRGTVARAAARIDTGAAGSAGPELIASVTLTNPTAAGIVLVVNMQCPVVIRLYTIDRPGGPPVYDGGAEGCTRAARVVELAPGEEATLSGGVPLSRLRSAGVGAGRYRVEAVVVASTTPSGASAGPFAVPAGEIEIR